MRRRLSGAAFATISLVTALAGAEAPRYKVGVVPQFDVAKTEAIWRPILAELSTRTGVTLELVTSADIPRFEQDLTAGAFDFAYMNPFHFLLAKRDHGYVPLVRDGAAKLQGIVVVAKNSSITKLEQLAGQKIAFPAPNALAASMLIRAALARDRKIAFVPQYLGNHTQAYEAALDGRVAAAGGVRRTLSEQATSVKDGLRVIFETSPVANHPFAAHPRVAGGDRDKIAQALLAMGAEPTARALLAAVPMEKVIAASAEDYRQLMRWGLQDFYVAPKD